MRSPGANLKLPFWQKQLRNLAGRRANRSRRKNASPLEWAEAIATSRQVALVRVVGVLTHSGGSLLFFRRHRICQLRDLTEVYCHLPFLAAGMSTSAT